MSKRMQLVQRVTQRETTKMEEISQQSQVKDLAMVMVKEKEKEKEEWKG